MACRMEVHIDDTARRAALARDVRAGLTRRPRSLPPKYFYDAAGSALFERITRLPEYYVTRVEEALLCAHAPGLVGDVAPRDIVELGSGGSAKVRCLLAAMNGAAATVRYVPVDVDGGVVQAAADALAAEHPGLEVHGVIGDFERHLMHVPRAAGRRLVVFLGSTLGNLDAAARHQLLTRVRRLLGPGDAFLLGVDLVKDPAVLHEAYNDHAGVTAAFNRNILHVVNRALGADFRPETFAHRAWYNARARRIEMHLASAAPQTVHVHALGLRVALAAGETIWTESSYKFTRAGVTRMLGRAGLRLTRWHADARRPLALALARPR